jgi:hypothetical protein
MLHLVQIADHTSRRVALVEEPHLRCLTGVASIYELAQHSIRDSHPLTELANSLATGESLSYDDVYAGRSPWHLLPPIDVPGAPTRTLVAGTGLTHLGSAKERQAMHEAAAAKKAEPTTITDSMRMFQWGVERGRPAPGQIGIAPEWFYKGDGSMLRAPFEALEIPGHAEDGGEEAEIAGVYLIGDDGKPHRIGMAIGNEFMGADALSFGDGIELRGGDWMDVRFDGFGRSLRNPIAVHPAMRAPVAVHALK